MSSSADQCQRIDRWLQNAVLVEQKHAVIDPTKPTYLCTDYAHIAMTSPTLAVHSTDVHLDKRFTHPFDGCDIPSVSQHKIDAHYGQAHGIFLCTFDGCTTRSSSQLGIDRHCRMAHQVECPVQACGATLSCRKDVLRHIQSFHAKARPLRCPHRTCERIFSTSDQVYAHYDGLHPLSIISPNKLRLFKCPFCPKTYQMERYMRPHQRRAHGPNLWIGR